MVPIPTRWLKAAVHKNPIVFQLIVSLSALLHAALGIIALHSLIITKNGLPKEENVR